MSIERVIHELIQLTFIEAEVIDSHGTFTRSRVAGVKAEVISLAV
jgi:hypothetical protein